MKREEEIKRVTDLLSKWVCLLRGRACLNFTDINIVSEDFAANLLNAYFDLHLVNLNHDQGNYPGIDLGDEKKGVAFQVTSTTTKTKISESLSKLRGEDRKKFSKGIRFLLISLDHKPKVDQEAVRKYLPSFNPAQDILNVNDLIRLARKYHAKEPSRWQRIDDILAEEFDDRSATPSPPRQPKKDLSNEALQLLLEASQGDGRVLWLRNNTGIAIEVNGSIFIETEIPKERVKWKSVFKELLEYDYLDQEGSDGTVFIVTQQGYDNAELLSMRPLPFRVR